MKLRSGAIIIGAFGAVFLAGTFAAPAFAMPSGQHSAGPQRAREFPHRPATGLVGVVREATARYKDVERAQAEGYTPVLGCVSSPDEGAMGVHYLNPVLFGDGVVDAAHPELLVYEPQRNGRMRLVAVEYIMIADNWDTRHADGSPPILMGQLFDYAPGPNRFRLPPNYSLHVWAWKYNPKGTFSMWNPRVSCAEYTGT